ncbi:hypothetical protein [Pandoraea sp. PE-S2T-3]|uniref:hypothetical protein n=1 Tax=Pandoraea sp. PE-S2T-3 TaxID=1986993 RepID=UPI000B3FA160|nr:hypothetical protein [Pandoraea sp. PE-S2T-3]
MTVLNRMAVALAADSAVTFSTFANGHLQRTYASGANKIFQLSTTAPIGVMLFNNAALQDVPWELIVKSFRTSLGSDVKNSVQEYADALSEFVRANMDLFPPAHREKHFKQLAARSFFYLLKKAQSEKPVLANAGDASVQQAAIADFLASEIATNAAKPLSPTFVDADVAKAKADHAGWLAQEIATYLAGAPQLQHLAAVIPTQGFAELAIESLYRFYEVNFNSDYTGIVVAGFGEKDYFPAYSELRYYGFLLDRLIVEHVESKAINHDVEAVIEAFAKKSMVDTFLSGFAPEVWSTVNGLFRVHVNQLVSGLNLAPATAATVPTLIATAEGEFAKAWSAQVWETHYAPLNSVISGLPPNEMAELAETLVMLESLKEKVTQRTQSVGGPVDVAVITKSEGLVWIKRKHYFSPELNPRYFVRQSQ